MDAPRDRKAEHIRLALEPGMQATGDHAFDDHVFENVALPELDAVDIDLGATFLGKPLRAPLLISCMTGGTELAGMLNRRLAEAAERCGVAFGVGSQRKALEDPEQAATFQVRDCAPTIPILANLGAVQLNYGFGRRECERAVEMVRADALALHLNPLQEAIQPEGQTNFRGLLARIEALVRELPVPVVVKEIGCGISEGVARRLHSAGVRILDTAGSGGTSWARIEGQRARDTGLGELFAGWGIPTPESIRQVRRVPGLTIIGSGGIRSGLDAAKAIALGADLVGVAQPFLEAAMDSTERVVAVVEQIVRELRIAMLCTGAPSISDLKQVPLRQRGRAAGQGNP